MNNPKRRPLRPAREPAKREWRGSLIGRAPENADRYLARLDGLVADGKTHLYFDASFLMWLAKLGERARAEFLAWVAKADDSRFHAPLWAAHEFFKHRLLNTISKEFGAEVKAFDTAASNLYEKLRIYCSDELFGFKSSGVIFLDEYRRTVQPIRAMLRLAEKSTQFEAGVQEIASFIDGHLLSGSIEGLLNDIEIDERVRNRGGIPPSFKDAHKRGKRRGEEAAQEQSAGGDNSFGDLVFWREVLRHASGIRTGSIVILTADRKNDWFENQHGDQGLTETVRRRMQRPRPVPAPHPLLIREAFDRGAGDLVLLDPMYCGVLLERTGGSYSNFAGAALDANLPEPVKKVTEARTWARRFGAEAQLLGSRQETGKDEPEETFFDVASLNIDQFRPSSKLSKAAANTLQKLSTGNVVARAQIFAELDPELLKTWGVAELVALGRVALRIAEAGDPAALDFLSDLRDHAPDFPAQVREPIYFGGLAALYFDDELAPRAPQGSQAGVVLLEMVDAEEVRNAADALGEALDASRKLFYRPGEGTDALPIEVVIKPSADNKSPADLLAIKLNGVDLITKLQTEPSLRFTSLLDKPAGAADMQVGALLEVLTRYHHLPRHLIRTEANTDMVVRVPEYAGIEFDF